MTSTNGHSPKRAILYGRVSTLEQARSGFSLAQQLEALREYAAREGYEVLEEVVDPGQSGASLERPGMDRVRDLVAAGGVSVVLAQDRDRFAREPAYHYLLRREFEEHGCKIRALNDRGDDSPEGELTDGILDQLAKFERAKTTERTRRGKLRKPREGKLIANILLITAFASTPRGTATRWTRMRCKSFGVSSIWLAPRECRSTRLLVRCARSVSRLRRVKDCGRGHLSER